MIIVIAQLLRRKRRRHPNLALIEQRIERRRHDPDHRRGLPIEGELLAYQRGIGMEAVAPQALADHDYVVAAPLLLVVSKTAPGERRHAERRKKVCCHASSAHALRHIGRREVEARRGEGCKFFEDSVLRADVAEVADGNSAAIPAAPLFLQQHDPLWLLHGKRPQQHRIHHAEDGSVGADAQREREDGNHGKRRALAEQAPTVANVVEESGHPMKRKHAAGQNRRRLND